MAKYVTTQTWDDVPHLSPEVKAAYLSKVPPHLREARTKGMPVYSAGLIWPIDEAITMVKPFPIPNHWKRCFALDCGYNWTAISFGCENPDTGQRYIYDCEKFSRTDPAIVYQAIIDRGGRWMAGVADAKNLANVDGTQYIQIYQRMGLDVVMPNRALQTGLTEVWSALSTGIFKVFSTCTKWFDEVKVYERWGSEKQGAVKEGQDDHLCDNTRHMWMSGFARGKVPPEFEDDRDDLNRMGLGPSYGPHSWMAS